MCARQKVKTELSFPFPATLSFGIESDVKALGRRGHVIGAEGNREPFTKRKAKLRQRENARLHVKVS